VICGPHLAVSNQHAAAPHPILARDMRGSKRLSPRAVPSVFLALGSRQESSFQVKKVVKV
jgi:hypothetical protein